MSKDELRYDRMVEEALRGVVRQALRVAETSGLPGDHHFYLTFRSTDPGVEISPSLRAQYPREMTIVLQHQFWGLEVGDSGFSVTLSFAGRHERLIVPYQSVVSFADPSVKFGLQFEAMDKGEEVPGSHSPREDARANESTLGKMPVPAKPAGLPVATSLQPEAEPKVPERSGGEVVTLDAFRKK